FPTVQPVTNRPAGNSHSLHVIRDVPLLTNPQAVAYKAGHRNKGEGSHRKVHSPCHARSVPRVRLRPRLAPSFPKASTAWPTCTTTSACAKRPCAGRRERAACASVGARVGSGSKVRGCCSGSTKARSRGRLIPGEGRGRISAADNFRSQKFASTKLRSHAWRDRPANTTSCKLSSPRYALTCRGTHDDEASGP